MSHALSKDSLEAAEAAVAYAKQVRRFHRRRTKRDSAQRAADIELALARLKEAMGPVRSAIGRFQHGPQTDAAEASREPVRELSRAIQSERRKLWKMQRTKPEEATHEPG